MDCRTAVSAMGNLTRAKQYAAAVTQYGIEWMSPRFALFSKLLGNNGSKSNAGGKIWCNWVQLHHILSPAFQIWAHDIFIHHPMRCTLQPIAGTAYESGDSRFHKCRESVFFSLTHRWRWQRWGEVFFAGARRKYGLDRGYGIDSDISKTNLRVKNIWGYFLHGSCFGSYDHWCLPCSFSITIILRYLRFNFQFTDIGARVDKYQTISLISYCLLKCLTIFTQSMWIVKFVNQHYIKATINCSLF